MVRKIPVVLAALVAAIGAGVLVVATGSGSSHREAPLTSVDPTADDTDVYAFKAPDAPNAADHRRQLDPVVEHEAAGGRDARTAGAAGGDRGRHRRGADWARGAGGDHGRRGADSGEQRRDGQGRESMSRPIRPAPCRRAIR